MHRLSIGNSKDDAWHRWRIPRVNRWARYKHRPSSCVTCLRSRGVPCGIRTFLFCELDVTAIPAGCIRPTSPVQEPAVSATLGSHEVHRLGSDVGEGLTETAISLRNGPDIHVNVIAGPNSDIHVNVDWPSRGCDGSLFSATRSMAIDRVTL